MALHLNVSHKDKYILEVCTEYLEKMGEIKHNFRDLTWITVNPGN